MIRFFKDRVQSFRHALRGIRDILVTEHNAKVHGVFTFAVLVISWWLNLESLQFLVVLIFIALVWITEAFNTVLEIVIDIVSPDYSNAAKRAKDIAAATVLFAAIGAVMAGLLIFIPALINRMD